MHIAANETILNDLTAYFSFEDEGTRFVRMAARRAVQNGKATPQQHRLAKWDGRYYLVNRFTRLMYRGLLGQLIRYCYEKNYKIEFDTTIRAAEKIADAAIQEFLDRQTLPYDLHQHQRDALNIALANQRALVLSPTSSGKSLIIYLLSKWLRERQQRHLIVIGRKGLALQLRGDFLEYGDDNKDVAVVMGGKNKNNTASCVIATWQTIRNMPQEWFDQFSGIIGDEVHTFAAKQLRGIMERLTACPFRIGLTGTLDESKCHEMILTGLFGKPIRVAKTADLIKRGISAPVDISIDILKHPTQPEMSYEAEMQYLTGNKARNKYIIDRAAALDGNVLILYRWIDTHGKQLFELAQATNRPAYFVHGGVDAEERDDLRAIIERENNALIVGSTGTVSTGINIKRLHHLVFGTPMKDKKGVLQSIGRLLRLADDKARVGVIDIGDVLRDDPPSYSIKHLAARVRYYEDEQFPFTIRNVNLQAIKID